MYWKRVSSIILVDEAAQVAKGSCEVGAPVLQCHVVNMVTNTILNGNKEFMIIPCGLRDYWFNYKILL